jgi:acyl carrier protein
MLKFDEFCRQLLVSLEVPVPLQLTELTRIYDELGLDSLQLFSLVYETERLAGLTETPPNLPSILTLGDVYQHYRRCVGQLH